MTEPEVCETCGGAGIVGYNPTSHPAWETDRPCPDCMDFLLEDD